MACHTCREDSVSKDCWPHKPQVENKGPLRKTLLERPRGKLGGLFFGCPRPIILLSSLQSCASHLTTRDTGPPLPHWPLSPSPFLRANANINQSQRYCLSAGVEALVPSRPHLSSLHPQEQMTQADCFTGTCVPEGLKEKLSLEKPGQRP